MLDRLALAARLVVPAVWIGIIIAIDLIEAPLKFQAPGITIPLGLGIGRLVFTAMNIAEVVLAIALILAVLRRPRPTRPAGLVAGAVFVLLAVKTAIVRPLLGVHTDAVLAGTSSGGSGAHYAYIVIDVLLFAALVVFLALQVRGLRIEPRTPVAASSDARGGNVGGSV